MPRPAALISAALIGIAATAAVLTSAGPAAATSTGGETYHALARPSRVLDTVTGAAGNRRGAIRAHGTISVHVAGRGRVPSSGVAAVAVTLTVRSPTASGALVAWPHATKRPRTVNVRFQRGKSAADLAIVPLAAGRIDIYNGSAGRVQVTADVTGYYRRDAGSAAGAFHPVSAARVVNTRTGAYGNRKGAIGARRAFAARVGGHAGVQSWNVAAVAVTITVTAKHRGSVRVWPYGGPAISYPTVQFSGDGTVSGFALVPTSASGRIVLFNDSGGPAQLTVDVVGYVTGRVSKLAGAYQPLDAHDVLHTGALGAGRQRTVGVTGRSGVPKADVRAVVVHVSALAPRRAGALVVWPAGRRPGAAAVQFSAGHNAGDTAIVPVSHGTIQVDNRSSGTVGVTVTVTGYVLGHLPAPPTTSTGRYVRDLRHGVDPTPTMRRHGIADADRGSRLVLLEFGAQSSDRQGVVLTATRIKLTYAEVVKAVQAYLAGFAGATDRTATVAIGTNNDGGGFDTYSASARGTNWANLVIDKLRPPAGLTVVAANDIEPGFASTEKQAQNWETAYLRHTSRNLIFNGSADGCPTRYGLTGRTCNWGWTQKQLYQLAHHGSRITVLPQVYNTAQAVQWADIDRTGGGGLIFAGSLTERAADGPSSLRPADGWTALRKATYTVRSSVALPAAVDLQVDG